VRRDQLKQAHDLAAEIERLEKYLAAYREADQVVVHLPPLQQLKFTHDFNEEHAVFALPAAVIVPPIVAYLERQIEDLQQDLFDLGVTD
jgi:hypothetical protein